MKRIYLFLLILCSFNHLSAQGLIGAEYFFDNDPGFGNGIAFFANTTGDSLSFSPTFSTHGLSEGLHTIYVRVQDIAGKWSHVQHSVFLIKDEAVSGEYFFDSDPGAGNGFPLQVVSSGDSISANSVNIPVSLPLGTHQLCVRLQNAAGIWGMFICEEFIVCNTYAPQADFRFTSTNYAVSFQDSSMYAEHYLWDFGDGQMDTTANPTHIYADTGVYGVSLYAENSCGQDTFTQDVKVIAGFPVSIHPAERVANQISFQNIPNPFSHSTQIRFEIMKTTQISIWIEDIMGRRVAFLIEENYTAGKHQLTWNGTDSHSTLLTSGIYFCRLKIKDQVFTRKMVLRKQANF